MGGLRCVCSMQYPHIQHTHLLHHSWVIAVTAIVRMRLQINHMSHVIYHVCVCLSVNGEYKMYWESKKECRNEERKTDIRYLRLPDSFHSLHSLTHCSIQFRCLLFINPIIEGKFKQYWMIRVCWFICEWRMIWNLITWFQWCMARAVMGCEMCVWRYECEAIDVEWWSDVVDSYVACVWVFWCLYFICDCILYRSLLVLFLLVFLWCVWGMTLRCLLRRVSLCISKNHQNVFFVARQSDSTMI